MCNVSYFVRTNVLSIYLSQYSIPEVCVIYDVSVGLCYISSWSSCNIR